MSAQHTSLISTDGRVQGDGAEGGEEEEQRTGVGGGSRHGEKKCGTRRGGRDTNVAGSF